MPLINIFIILIITIMATINQQAVKATTPATTGSSDKGLVTYQVAGQDVKLSYQIVRDFLVKGDGRVSDQDLVQFISVCKFNQLNPFLNEAFLVKYGNSPAQMIVSKEALMKRADACPNYDGMRAGVIVKHENGDIEDVEGCFVAPGDELIGGWACVYRSDRKFPFVSRVSLSEYDRKQSIWREKKSTMIAKIAKVQALREAFPAQLGAMYTQEEQSGVQLADYTEIKEQVQQEKSENANRTAVVFDDAPKQDDGDASQDVPQNPGF